MSSGLIATMVEAPLEIQNSTTIPQDHYAACRMGNNSYEGNAAGNTQNPQDLTGANTSPGPLPDGFTPRGIAAMAFSVLSALVGVAVIAWYGSYPIALEAGGR